MTVNTAENTEEVDTSTNDEGLDTEAELEESDINFDDADDDSEAEDTEDQDESDEEDEDDTEAEDTDQSEESQADVEKDQEKSDKADPEAARKEAARKAFEEREAARKAKQQEKTDEQKKYVKEAKGDADKAKRQLKIDVHNLTVQSNRDRLQNGLDKAVAHIKLFQNTDPVVKEALYKAVDTFEAIHVKKDKYGDPIEVSEDIFKYLQTEAESIQRLAGIREQNAKKAKADTKARTTTVPSRAPKEGKKDADLDAFDEEADRW